MICATVPVETATHQMNPFSTPLSNKSIGICLSACNPQGNACLFESCNEITMDLQSLVSFSAIMFHMKRLAGIFGGSLVNWK